MALDGITTHSEHLITVRRVEANAAGGLVGAGGAAFAAGGPVGALRRLGGGMVPGTGNADTVPRTLDAGAFVLRKAAVRKYGAGALSRLAGGMARFAGGGLAIANRKRAEEERERRSTTAPVSDPSTGWQSGDSFQSTAPPIALDTRPVPEALITASNVLAYAREMLTRVQNSPLLGALGPAIRQGIAAVESNPNDIAAIKRLLQAAETIGANPYVFEMWERTSSSGSPQQPIWFIDWLQSQSRRRSGGRSPGPHDVVGRVQRLRPALLRWHRPAKTNGTNPLVRRRMAVAAAPAATPFPPCSRRVSTW